MGILKWTIDVVDYFSTGIVLSILFNMAYGVVIDYMSSDDDDVWSFLSNYTPDFKALKFYNVVYKYLFK